jgi:hypothetical protein
MRLEAGDAPGGPALVLRLDEGRALRLDPGRRWRSRSTRRGCARLAPGRLGRRLADGRRRGRDAPRLRSRESARSPATPATGYRLKSRTASVDLWVAGDLPRGGSVFADFLEWWARRRRCRVLVAAIRELPGFPLETRARVSVLGETQETLSTVTKIRVGPQAESLFEVPSGWRVQPSAPAAP